MTLYCNCLVKKFIPPINSEFSCSCNGCSFDKRAGKSISVTEIRSKRCYVVVDIQSQLLTKLWWNPMKKMRFGNISDIAS